MTIRSDHSRIDLPQVTLCAATSINLKATIQALEASLRGARFASCLLFTDRIVQLDNPEIELINIPSLLSVEDYSKFVLSKLADYIQTSHCLISQWDGHLLDPLQWDPVFLDYDYVGASWPQFDDGHDVGNGGFSLRSRRLLVGCQSLSLNPAEAEDIAIGRTHRAMLEQSGMRFAPREVADRFSAERAGDPMHCFGFHGAWHMPRVVGGDSFWEIYRSLDDRSTIWHDFGSLLRQVIRVTGGSRRALQMILDRLADALKTFGKN